MVKCAKPECSFTSWYPLFKKDALRATVISIPEKVLEYLECDTFFLPVEATNTSLRNSKWNDGVPVTAPEDSEEQPTFPEFSKKLQDVIIEYGAVFIKCNWSSPMDAIWVAPTKTLKCNTLEEVYLLLKSSDRIAQDLNAIKHWIKDGNDTVASCLVLKQWQDINPCTEFRCFVIDKELVAISQRDISQYHSYNESEKYNIQTDIKSLFMERIQNRFPLTDYCFDIVRFKKDKVKIVDFGPLHESAVKGTLFTYEELQNHTEYINKPEFRFIGEEIGIQPKITSLCVPQEITEFFQASSDTTVLDMIQREVDNQRLEQEERNTDDT